VEAGVFRDLEMNVDGVHNSSFGCLPMMSNAMSGLRENFGVFREVLHGERSPFVVHFAEFEIHIDANGGVRPFEFGYVQIGCLEDFCVVRLVLRDRPRVLPATNGREPYNLVVHRGNEELFRSENITVYSRPHHSDERYATTINVETMLADVHSFLLRGSQFFKNETMGALRNLLDTAPPAEKQAKWVLSCGGLRGYAQDFCKQEERLRQQQQMLQHQQQDNARIYQQVTNSADSSYSSITSSSQSTSQESSLANSTMDGNDSIHTGALSDEEICFLREIVEDLDESMPNLKGRSGGMTAAIGSSEEVNENDLMQYFADHDFKSMCALVHPVSNDEMKKTDDMY